MEEVTFYEFHIILNEVVKMYCHCCRNLTPTVVEI